MTQKKANDVCTQIAEIRRLSGRDMRAHERREQVTHVVIEDLKSKGRFFRTPQDLFYFENSEKPKLFPIDEDSIALSTLIAERYGINAAERREYEHLLKGMCNEAYQRGQRVDVHRLAHFDPDLERLYVSRFDGWVYRLNGKQIRLVPNGTDGVFFWDDPRWQPYEIVRKKRPEGLLGSLIAGSANFGEADGLTAEDQRWLFRAWLLSQFFDSLLPTKPILLVCGEKGGGKTLALRKWLRLLFGQEAEVTALERSKPDGFVAAVCSLPVAVFDNVDERISWLPDHLAQLATGVTFKRRKYYTTNEQVEYKPRCFLALTSRTPKFIEGRDDVLDRTLLLQTERRAEFGPEQAQLQQVAKKRNLLWTELLRDLNRIVAVLPQCCHVADRTSFRMADFASFAMSVAGAEGQPNRAARILERLEGRRAELLLSDEPIFICLEKWLVDPKSRGRRVNSGELYQELRLVAARMDIRWPYTSGHSLGQRLAHITTNLSERLVVEVERDSANQRWYRFCPKTESLIQTESEKASIQAANSLNTGTLS